MHVVSNPRQRYFSKRENPLAESTPKVTFSSNLCRRAIVAVLGAAAAAREDPLV